MTGTSASTTVLDFDPRDVEEEAAAMTRRLLGRVLAIQGSAGLAQALHVTSSRAAQLKHRVTCVTCRSRLDTLATSLATVPISTSAAEELPPLEYPAPLSAWLAADSRRGLEPAPRALRDPNALAAFLTAFGGSAMDMEASTQSSGSNRAGGRSGGVDRCPYHAPRPSSLVRVLPAMAGAPPPLSRASPALSERERERYIAVLRCSITDSEWKKLGSVDIDSSMCELFSWLADRGLCSSCVDAVTGALLEVRRAVTGNCTCSRCLGLCGKYNADKGKDEHGNHIADAHQEAANETTTTTCSQNTGGTPELLRVQGQLRAICGVYRKEPVAFNGRPVYKKERAEAYLLYTSLKDWMVSGKADAGGSKCEGWAYVTDNAETPDEVCGVWKVSGSRGWEEDPTLCVTVFEGLPEDMRLSVGYDDGSFIAQRLTADDRGVLMVPLQEPEVMEEVLWATDEAPPVCPRTGNCLHVTTAEMAQMELRCWLRWFLRERLDAHRRQVLGQAQVASSLCRIFAGAALQQLEQSAEEPASSSSGTQKRDKKKSSKKPIRTMPLQEEMAGVDSESAPSAPPTTSSSAGPPQTDICPASRSVAQEGNGDSDESSSTRASSEEPPDAESAAVAQRARRLMEQMGWQPEDEMPLGEREVEAWREQHPAYRQAIMAERQKLRHQFLAWTRTTFG